jgi:Skp family chaperone for outer membrane proteins
MRKIWRRKWIVIPAAAIIVLAAGTVGAVALADPGGDEPSTEVALAATTATTGTALGVANPGATQGVQDLSKRRAKLQERLERIKKRWVDARAKMSPADQAAFDQLQQKANGQRETLQEARKGLAETLKQMRTLVQKYRPATTTTSAP